MERNLSLDIYKILLSILVIAIHTAHFAQPGLSGWIIPQGLSRIAVPTFFLISGYYFFRTVNDKEKVKKRLLRLCLLYVVWMLVYLPLYYDFRPLKMLVTNILFGYSHLWFIPALTLSLLLLFLIRKLIKSNIILLVVSVILYIWGWIAESHPSAYTTPAICSWILGSFPMVVIGYLINAYGVANKKWEPYLWLLAIIGFALIITESYFDYTINYSRNLLIGNILICPAIFVLIMKRGKYYASDNPYLTEMSSAIYYIHMMMILALPRPNFTSVLPIFCYVTVASVIAALFIIFVNKKIKILL